MEFTLPSRPVFQLLFFHAVDVERQVGENVVGTEVAVEVALALAGVSGEEEKSGRHVDGPSPLASPCRRPDGA